MRFQPTYAYTLLKEEIYEQEMQAAEHILEKHLQTGYFKSFDRAELFYEYYLAQNAKASVVIIHGYTEFSKKYHELCLYFLQMGYNVFLYDQRGHGNSHREVPDLQITHIDHFSDYVRDLDCFIKCVVQPAEHRVPIYLFGHSMGGAVSALYLAQCGTTVTKAVLSSPMIYPVCMSVPRWLLRFSIRKLAMQTAWNAKFKFSASFNPEAKQEDSADLSQSRFRYNLNTRIQNKNYQNSASTNRWNYEALGVRNQILRRKTVRQIKAKVFIISAGRDTMVRLEPQQKLAKRLKCRYQCFENAKHSLYTQKNKELKAYFDAVLNFFAE